MTLLMAALTNCLNLHQSQQANNLIHVIKQAKWAYTEEVFMKDDSGFAMYFFVVQWPNQLTASTKSLADRKIFHIRL